MLQKFLTDISLPGCVIQAGPLNRVDACIKSWSPQELEKFVEANPRSNLFFMAGVKDSPGIRNERAEDDDIKLKNYFYFDFDIRKGSPYLEDEDIVYWGENTLPELLSADAVLAKWRYIIFSGNGIHVYYFGKQAIEISDKNAWKEGLRVLIEQAELLTDEKLDNSCVNVARIGRLPGSFNRKHNPPSQVRILKFQDTKISLSEMVATGERRITERRETAAQSSPPEDKVRNDTYNAIQKLPISEIVCRVMGWELMPNGKNFRDPSGGKHKATYIIPERNIVMHGGSDHIPKTANGFAPFEFVKAVKGLSTRDTFFWFKDHYPQVRIDKKPGAENTSYGIEEILKELQSSPPNCLHINPELTPFRLLARKKVTRIGALFGTGKSKFGYFLADQLLRSGYRGIIFSTEVDTTEVLAHLISIQLGCKYMDILEQKRSPSEASLQIYSGLKIFDVRHTSNSLRQMEDLIAKAKTDGGVDFIMLDYSQMIDMKPEVYNWAREYGKNLQSLAQRHDVAIIDVCQLGKEGLTDLHEQQGYIPFEGGGPLNQSADVSILISRNKSLGTYDPHCIVDVRKSKTLQRRVRLNMIYDWKHSSFRLEGSSDDAANVAHALQTGK